MSRPLRLLIVEDKPDDAELVVLALKQGGFNPTWKRVETVDELRAALTNDSWDAVLSDYTLPMFSAEASLRVVGEFDPDLPFIVVSGTVGEDVAVKIMRAGASDYVLKHSLTRLAPALVRELGEAANRRSLKQAEKAMRASEIRYRRLFEAAQDGVLIVDVESRQILDANPFLSKLLGYKREELVGKELWEIGFFDDIEANKAAFRELQEKAYLRYEDLPLATKDGRSIDVEFVSNIYDAGDDRVIQCNIRDIGVRKRVEETLREKKEKLAEAVRLARLGYWNRDLATEQVEWSEMLYEIFGVTPNTLDLTFETFLATIHPDDRRVVFDRIKEAVAVAGSFDHSYRILVGGEVREIHEVGHISVSVDGTPIRITGTAQDITEQSRAAAAVQASEERYRTLIAATSAIVWNSPPSGAFNSDQPAWTAFTEQTAEEHRGWGWLNVVHPDDREKSAHAWAAAVATRGDYQIEHRLRRRDGEYRQMSVRAVPIRESNGEIREFVGVHTDVTDQARVENERAELLAQLTLQIERMPLAYLLSGPDGRYTRWNPAAERMFEFTEAEIVGQFRAESIVPPQSEAFVAAILTRLEAGDMNAHGTCENVTKSGRTIDCEWHNTPLFSADGVFQGILSLAQDVTARRQAEKALHLRDRAIQAATQGLMITDPAQMDNPLIYVNHGFEQLTGYVSEEVLGRNCRFLQGVDTAPNAVAQMREAIQARKPITLEILNYRKNGTSFWNKLSIAPILDTAGQLTHFVGVQADISAQRQLEDQFRQAQKLEAFGQLAGGVAHDFNNLLTIINGYSALLLQSLPEADPSWQLISEILKAGERSAGLTRQLLAFSRKQVMAPQVLNLNVVVTETDKMLRRLIGEDIRLTTTLDSKLWAVEADPGQLEQVLLNLAVNARDAMPKGGRLTIETQNIQLDENYTRTHADASAGPHVLLSVSDTGSGMSPEVQSRIFEPFFTTKRPGKGTGLGLATVFGIVKQSGGHVTVYSEVGVGTSFKVYLPKVEQQSEGLKAPSRIVAPPRGTETVLLAEDEVGVRNLTSLILADCGYKVLEASDGEEAIRVADGHHAPIHLLITDVVMPGAGGRTVSEVVTRRHPEVRVLYISGYTDDAVIRHGVLREGVHFLQKPFSPLALALKVREIIDS